MDFEPVVDEILDKLSPEIIKSVGVLTKHGYEQIWNFIKKSFSKEKAVKLVEKPGDVTLKNQGLESLYVLIQDKYANDSTFKNVLDNLIRINSSPENRTVFQSGGKSLYIESNQGDINIS